ncbi:MAG: DUF493 family protein [Spirochaetia bacterium]
MVQKHSGNGGEGIRFPLDFKLRVIMQNDEDLDNARIHLENILLRADVGFTSCGYKESAEGKYIRFAMDVTVKNRETMNRLYQDLNEDPAVKAAI